MGFYMQFPQLEATNRDLLERAYICSEKSPSDIGRFDLMRLMTLAGLADTKSFLQLALGSRDTVTLSTDILRCMIRLASAGNSDPALVSPRLGRGRHRAKTASAPLVEERLVEDESGALKWEVRLTPRGVSERTKVATATAFFKDATPSAAFTH
jgi:hypothetical protein